VAGDRYRVLRAALDAIGVIGSHTQREGAPEENRPDGAVSGLNSVREDCARGSSQTEKQYEETSPAGALGASATTDHEPWREPLQRIVYLGLRRPSRRGVLLLDL
jgi:hypothetical protein